MNEFHEPTDFGLPPRPNIVPDGPFPPLDHENPQDLAIIEEADGDRAIEGFLQARRALIAEYQDNRNIEELDFLRGMEWITDAINTVREERDLPRP
jgi:hypothetical protein